MGKSTPRLCGEGAGHALGLPSQPTADCHIKPVAVFSLDSEVHCDIEALVSMGSVTLACANAQHGPGAQAAERGISQNVLSVLRAPYPAAGPGRWSPPHLLKRLLRRTIRRKPVGSVTELSLLFISSNCWSMMSPASLSVSLLAQALQEEWQSHHSERRSALQSRTIPTPNKPGPGAALRRRQPGPPRRPHGPPLTLLAAPGCHPLGCEPSQEVLRLNGYQTPCVGHMLTHISCRAVC